MALLFKPVPEFIEHRTSWYPWIILINSLLIIGLLAAFLKKKTCQTTKEETAKVQDDSETRRLEASLIVSEEKNRRLIETSRDAIICIDEDGLINVWNPSAEKTFGYSRSEIIGQPVTLIIPDEHIDAYQKGLEHFLQTGKSKMIGKTVALTGKTKDGIEVPIEMSLSFQKSGNERYTFIAAIKDLSFRKESKERMIQNLKEVAKVNNELKDIVIIISNNLKNPLLTVEDYSEKIVQD